jgi:aspartyl-tRNA(Asn)/glutamyl-tRNA(Gln) amidotransferase subunit C
MTKIISQRDVEYIARLARLYLEKSEIERLSCDLEEILGYIQKLTKLDVTGIEPTSHVLPIQNVCRDDVIQESLPQNDALSIAVEQHKGYFKVPQVIE